jgi:hypothetical protein
MNYKKLKKSDNNFVFYILFVLVIIFYILLLAKEINLTNSDLGRHLKNGEIILTKKFIPKTNLYSYTFPDFPFYNHHWLSGVVFYVVCKMFGFSGLSVFYIFISVITFFIFFITIKNIQIRILL